MIIFENVTFSYRDGEPILKGVGFKAEDGAVTTLVGPNASGKTTLLRLVVGLHKPDDGVVLLDNRNTTTLGGERGKYVAAVMGEERPEGLSVLQYVLWGAVMGSGVLFEGQKELNSAMEALNMVDASHLVERPLYALSSGEWQRVQVARAFAQKTKNIILDEPTAHLDISHKLRLLTSLQKLASLGRCVLLILHDVNLACRFSDKIVVLHKGKTVASGPPTNVITPEIIRSVWKVEADVVHEKDSVRVLVKTALEGSG